MLLCFRKFFIRNTTDQLVLITVMQNIYRYFSGLLFVLFTLPVFSQINVNTDISIIELVESLEGEGTIIENVEYSFPGSGTPIGSFNDFSGDLGFSNGLLMTTGDANLAPGPAGTNPNEVASVGLSGPMNYPLLEEIEETNYDLYDVVVVEFDITVAGHELLFNYVFASEEYPQYTPYSTLGDYNDVFGLFISGPGITGIQNLAIVPGTQNQAVSVNSINHVDNNNLYRGYDLSPIDDQYGEFQNGSPELLKYGGYTFPLEARADVLPCETYHITLAIADVKDSLWDSGVFIEGESFTSIPAPGLTEDFEFPQYDYVIRGCNALDLKFSRPEGIPSDREIEFLVEIGGSAEPETDYESDIIDLDTLRFPEGVDTVSFPLQALEREELTGPLTVDIDLYSTCDLLTNRVFSRTITIEDFFRYEIDTMHTVCKGEAVFLNNPEPPPYFVYDWGGAEGLSCNDCSSPTAQPQEDITYEYAIIDTISGCETNGQIHFDVVTPIPYFQASQIEELTTLDWQFDNQSQNSHTYSWDFGDGGSSTEENPNHTYGFENLDEPKPYTIELTAYTFEPKCEATYDTTIIIDNPLFIPNIITPNDDGFNDDFVIRGLQEGLWTFRVFNRWGERVYEDKAYSNDWSARGLSDGMYYFELVSPNEQREYKGWVKVIR